MKKRPVCTFLIFFILFKCIDSSRILAIMPESESNDFLMMERLMKALVERGHEIDVVSHYPQKKKIPRYNDLSIAGIIPHYEANMQLQEAPYFWDDIVLLLKDLGYELCKTVFDTPVMQELKTTNKTYDLLITKVSGTDCFLGFMHHFKIPSIVLTTGTNFPWGSDRFGNPDNPSYIPSYFVSYLDDMNLFERFINTALNILIKILHEMISVWNSDTIARNFFGEDMPSLKTLMHNVSLMLVNSHFSINFPRPTVPNFVEVGGLHMTDSKPLPEKFEKIMTTDKIGIIFLTMGHIKTNKFDNDKLQCMFDALGDLDYKVIWKANTKDFNETLRIPSNIHFEKQMPEIDILCHAKVKLLITHGGLMGSQEAIYCGVPWLGIPILGDHHLNMKTSEAMGLAIKVDYAQITYQRFSNALIKLLDKNEGYKQRSEEASKLFKDRPLSALDTAVYWVEYVIEHNGAPHLRTKGADLYWYQYYLLDVAFLFTGIIFTLVSPVYGFVKMIKNRLRRIQDEKNVEYSYQNDKKTV